MTLEDGATVVVMNPGTPTFVPVEPPPSPDGTTVLVLHAGLEGPAGPAGPSLGPAGQPRFTGEGPPGLIVGAAPLDVYLDTLTGDLYRLG